MGRVVPAARPLGDVAASRLPDVTDRRTIMNEMRKLDIGQWRAACLGRTLDLVRRCQGWVTELRLYVGPSPLERQLGRALLGAARESVRLFVYKLAGEWGTGSHPLVLPSIDVSRQSTGFGKTKRLKASKSLPTTAVQPDALGHR